MDDAWMLVAMLAVFIPGIFVTACVMFFIDVAVYDYYEWVKRVSADIEQELNLIQMHRTSLDSLKQKVACRVKLHYSFSSMSFVYYLGFCSIKFMKANPFKYRHVFDDNSFDLELSRFVKELFE